jgi:hypothetical protein
MIAANSFERPMCLWQHNDPHHPTLWPTRFWTDLLKLPQGARDSRFKLQKTGGILLPGKR